MLLFIALLFAYPAAFLPYFYAIAYIVWITSPLWYGLLEEIKRIGWMR